MSARRRTWIFFFPIFPSRKFHPNGHYTNIIIVFASIAITTTLAEVTALILCWPTRRTMTYYYIVSVTSRIFKKILNITTGTPCDVTYSMVTNHYILVQINIRRREFQIRTPRIYWVFYSTRWIGVNYTKIAHRLWCIACTSTWFFQPFASLLTRH